MMARVADLLWALGAVLCIATAFSLVGALWLAFEDWRLRRTKNDLLYRPKR